MHTELTIDKCRAFVDSQLIVAQNQSGQKSSSAHFVVTLSRQTGAGARTIASRLAEYLGKHDTSTRVPWTAFDRNLVEKVLEDHHLPQRLAQYMVEDKLPTIDDGLGELLGLHPSSCILVQDTIETIVKLAQMGNVILVGRGASIITHSFSNAFHVRLVGSPEKRSAHIAEVMRLSPREAAAYIRREDRKRKRYIKTYFGANIEDPMQYHMVINTDLISYDEATILIGEAVLRKKNGN
jgi:cytidylate kinase